MTYIKDLAVWDYALDVPADTLIAVGWLSKDHPYPVGNVSVAFFRKLCQLLQNPWQPFVCGGHHTCDLCQFSSHGQAHFENYEVPSASAANLFVPSQGNVFVAPELITHYVDAHHYKPPEAFIAAVMACPPMHSMAYKRALLANGGRILISK